MAYNGIKLLQRWVPAGYAWTRLQVEGQVLALQIRWPLMVS